MSLKDLKSSTGKLFDNFKKQQESSQSSRQNDDRIWTPSYDKQTGGVCRVRFLPPKQGEDMPFVAVYSHGFKGPTGKWYIENSLSTLKQKDPVGEMNSRLWNSGVESDKDVARDHKRRTNYFANIIVLEDPINPENNGKVKIFRYGPMIHKLLEQAMFPEFETDQALNPFDPWEGADFELRTVMKQVGKDRVPNYERSKFLEPSKIGTDKEIEAYWEQCHSLEAFIAPDQFKTYDELKNRLYEVLGATVGSGIAVVESYAAAEIPQEREASKPTETPSKAEPAQSSKDDDTDLPFDTDDTTSSDSMEDDMDFFNNL